MTEQIVLSRDAQIQGLVKLELTSRILSGKGEAHILCISFLFSLTNEMINEIILQQTELTIKGNFSALCDMLSQTFQFGYVCVFRAVP